MTSAQQAELCRITVFGPAGRADLAVPVTIPVAGLLPLLLKHTSDSNEHVVTGLEGSEGSSWVLQRVGEPPLDPQGTPESLDWLEGETFHLRPAANPLPELAFDDIADGMATAVGRQRDRWRPEFGRWLYLALSAAVLAVVLVLVLGAETTIRSTATAAVIGALLVGASVVSGRMLQDDALVLVLGVSGCLHLALAGAVAVNGTSAVLDLDPLSVSSGGLLLALSSGIVLGARALWAQNMPMLPFAALFAIGVVALLSMLLLIMLEMTPVHAAGIYSAFALALLVAVPRTVIRMARLRGPQLPRTADELQDDVDPLGAELLIERTKNADRYLTVFMVTSALIFICAFPTLYDSEGWAPTTLALLVTTSALIRSGGFLGAWQRVSLVVAGATGLVLLLVDIDASMGFGWRVFVISALAVVLLALMFAVLRPPSRRVVPVWVRRAHLVESLVAVAVIPVLLQILGVYAWARGLAG